MQGIENQTKNSTEPSLAKNIGLCFLSIAGKLLYFLLSVMILVPVLNADIPWSSLTFTIITSEFLLMTYTKGPCLSTGWVNIALRTTVPPIIMVRYFMGGVPYERQAESRGTSQ